MNKVTVLGSLNVDTILKVQRLPKPGETLQIISKQNAGGGKGANQGIAAARSNAQTSFIGKIGKDENGKMMCEVLRSAGIDITNVTTASSGTGQAFILLQKNGENSILVYGGANQELTAADVQKAKNKIVNSDFLVTQFETPLECAIEGFKIAKNAGVATILNPAPAKKIPTELMQNVDLITPNETEAELLTGIKVIDEKTQCLAAEKLLEFGAKNVIITLGSKGAFYQTKNERGFVPAFRVDAVDTTAAGDTFLGVLSSQLDKDFSNIKEAIKFANKASALAVQKLGAIPSIPSYKEIKRSL